MTPRGTAQLVLQDGSCLLGDNFGAGASAAGEVVFNTGMVGYPEAMTDPSYRGQLLVLTYPLIGNYGVRLNGTSAARENDPEMSAFFESERVQVAGLIIATLSPQFSHWSAHDSLDSWMKRQNIPGLCGVDTRGLTKKLRTRGTMLGKLIVGDKDIDWFDPDKRNLVADVSIEKPKFYTGSGRKTVVLVDFGSKYSILRHLNRRGLNVLRVPWNHDWSSENVDGVVLSNGPGDPKMCHETFPAIRRSLERNIPLLGICLGHQLLALAVGADTFKLKYGHRGQNQPCIEAGTKRCIITSQNHGFAVDEQTLPAAWKPWFFNANDGTNEGMRHLERPIFSVQFHPEANPGPVDASYIFDSFAEIVERGH